MVTDAGVGMMRREGHDELKLAEAEAVNEVEAVNDRNKLFRLALRLRPRPLCLCIGIDT